MFQSHRLGLSIEMFGTVFGQVRTRLWAVLERSRVELLCLFWTIPRLIVGLLIVPCVLFFVLLLKMNNMLIMRIMLVYACMIY